MGLKFGDRIYEAYITSKKKIMYFEGIVILVPGMRGAVRETYVAMADGNTRYFSEDNLPSLTKQEARAKLRKRFEDELHRAEAKLAKDSELLCTLITLVSED